MTPRIATKLAHAAPLLVAGCLAALHLLVAGLAFDPVPHAGGDNTAYITLARSILETGRYTELWDPARPPHAQYPPGFPLILAAAFSVGITSWAALKTMMLGFSGLAIGLSYLWMRARIGPAAALSAGVILAIAPGLAGESHWVLSDVPFWAVTMAALLALERRRVGIAIALAFTALFIRAAGLPLLAAIGLWLLLRRRWRAAAGLTLGVAVLVGVWSLRARGIEAPYTSDFLLVNPYAPEAGRVGITDLAVRIFENADSYAFGIFLRVLTGAGGLFADIPAAMILAVAGIGFGRRVRGRFRVPGPVEIFAALYLAMLLLWPSVWASDRFLLPLIPLLLAYAVEGVDALPGARARRMVRAGGFALLVLMSAVPLASLWVGAADCRAAVRESGAIACLGPNQRAFLGLARNVRGTLPDGAVVLSRKPRQWYHYSGVPGRVYPFSSDPDRLLEVAEEVGARYVVLDGLGSAARSYVLPTLVRYPERFCAVRRVRQGPGEAVLLGIVAADAALDEAAVGGPPPAGEVADPGRQDARVGELEQEFRWCPEMAER